MKINKKAIAGFELTTLIVATFAFAFMLALPEVRGLGEYNEAGDYVGPPETYTPPTSAPNLVSGVGPLVGAGAASKVIFAGTKTGTLTLADGSVLNIADATKATFAGTKEAGGVLTYAGKDYTISKELAPKVFDQLGLTAPVGKPSSMLSQLFGVGGGSFADALATGVQWAAVAAGVGYLIGGLLGFSSNNQAALAAALGLGTFAWQFLANSNWAAATNVWGTTSLGSLALPIGIGVAVVVFVMMYKKESTQTVTFQCMPWQAPNGGSKCEDCNDQNLPCSEYRCRALGQSCELLNAGTGQEKCVSINPRDVSPPVITPDEKELTIGYKYTDVKNMPPGPGFKIIGSGQECVKAFTPLQFGVNTDEPAQCKIDFNHTTNFDDMSNWFGNTNLYLYNHTEQFSLPGPANLQGENLTILNDGKWTFFVRCKDKNGNANEAEYAIRFCVDPSPDTTAPEIKATSIANNAKIPANKDSAIVDFYVNEPAECRYSKEDQSYDVMQNTMSCATQVYQMNAMQLYPCRANLTGISRDLTTFYVRCKDQPNKETDRNVNRQSYVYSLQGSTELKMRNLLPNGTIYGSVSPYPVNLHVETIFGSENGKSICYYSRNDNDADYIQFFDTENDDGISTQRQDLAAGRYTYYYKCVDSAGNVAKNSTSFTLDVDTNAPVIARVYEESGKLKVITVKNSECAYSFNDCDFTFQEADNMPYANSTMHVADWKEDKTYYIKCRDEFKNEPTDCSIVVRPTKNFL